MDADLDRYVISVLDRYQEALDEKDRKRRMMNHCRDAILGLTFMFVVGIYAAVM